MMTNLRVEHVFNSQLKTALPVCIPRKSLPVVKISGSQTGMMFIYLFSNG